MPMLTIRLYGDLKKFGREFTLQARSPLAAVHALCTMIPALKRRLSQPAKYGYHVRVGREFKGSDDVADPCSSREIIRLIPATAGSSATVRIVVGVVLMAVGAYMTMVSDGAGSPMGSALMGMGMSLIMGGIAELLAPAPKKAEGLDKNVGQSYTFSGPINTVGQGPPVSVGFGTLLTGSHVASVQVYTEDMPMTGLGDVAPGDLANTDDGISHNIGTVKGNWAE